MNKAASKSLLQFSLGMPAKIWVTKKIKTMREWYFTHLPGRSYWGDRLYFWCTRRYRRHNHPCQILWQSVQVFWSFDTPNIAILYKNSWSPLLQCNCVSTTVLDCDEVNAIGLMAVEQESKFLRRDQGSSAGQVDWQSSLAVHVVPRELSAQVWARSSAADSCWLHVAAAAAWRPSAHWRVLLAGVCRETAVSLFHAASRGPAAEHEVGRQPQRTVHCYRWRRFISSHSGNCSFRYH